MPGCGRHDDRGGPLGTWDSGPFGNDAAADWCRGPDDAEPAARAGLVEAAPAHAADTPPGTYLDDGEHTVAAAALVAAQCPRGEPAESAYGPRRPAPGPHGPASPRPRSGRPGPHRAVRTARTVGARAPSWHGATDRLRAALAPEPVGERATLG
ncbi:DUF4259 domain-containing protein [Streptomyces sp. SPB78]|uniref:DUF4259 domain-containing protein n=1 Tax=Streptomyces sp. (strain SPB78) TaxID=591157 RepID=UPI002D21C086|nr:DUF4259 domain-containing protein [Streptomyces sp. SPB78]